MTALADDRPAAGYEQQQRYEMSIGKGRLGVLVMSLTPELRMHLGTSEDRGVIVARVDPGSPADDAGIEVGDVITTVRGKPIQDASDVMAAIGQGRRGQMVNVSVIRDRNPMTFQVRVMDQQRRNYERYQEHTDAED